MIILRRSLGLILLALGGCAGSPSTHLYILARPGAPANPDPSEAANPPILLQPVLLADYLDTTDIVVRSGQNELRSLPAARWAENLGRALTDALRAALTARLPGKFVTLDTSQKAHALQILVDVSVFDVWPDGHCVLSASWTILQPGGQSILTSGRESFRTATTGAAPVSDAVIVAGMASAVDELGARLAAAVESVSAPLPATSRENATNK